MRQKKSLLRVLATLCLPQSFTFQRAYLCQICSLTIRPSLRDGEREESAVQWENSKSSQIRWQLPKEISEASSFLQQKGHHWPSSCWTPLLGSLSRPFCHFAKGNLCNKCLNTQLEQMVMCMLACHQSSEKPDMQQPPYFKKARLFLIPASLQQDLILEIWMKVT